MAGISINQQVTTASWQRRRPETLAQSSIQILIGCACYALFECAETCPTMPPCMAQIHGSLHSSHSHSLDTLSAIYLDSLSNVFYTLPALFSRYGDLHRSTSFRLGELHLPACTPAPWTVLIGDPSSFWDEASRAPPTLSTTRLGPGSMKRSGAKHLL